MWIQALVSLPPASSSSTLVPGSAVSRLASTHPAEPAPTTMKSASLSNCITPPRELQPFAPSRRDGRHTQLRLRRRRSRRSARRGSESHSAKTAQDGDRTPPARTLPRSLPDCAAAREEPPATADEAPSAGAGRCATTSDRAVADLE